MNRLSIFLCLVAIIASVSATDYCSSSICNGKSVTHIACGHNGKFVSTCPADATMITITSSLKQLLVNAHNEKRNLLAGGSNPSYKKACRMALMKWDDELAAVAAYNVKQCKMAHDKCRNTDAFKYSGQNLAWIGFYGTTDSNAMLAKSVQMWYNEEKDCNQTIMDKYPRGYTGPAIGHFTSMMADRNIRVGCAAATYTPSGAPYKAYLLACNYATTNMVGFPIYEKCDKAASKCTTGTDPTYSSLCSSSEVYDVNKWY